MQALLPVIYGAALGAILAVPARLLHGFLLKQRGIDPQMVRKHFWMLLAGFALVGGVIGWRAGVTFRGLYLMLLLLVAGLAFLIDAKHRIIPNELVLAILVLAAVFGLTGAIRFQIWDSLLGLAACFVIFFLPGLFGKQVGAGDVKLAAVMGFALGLKGSLYAIACMGALVLLYVILDWRIPFVQRLKTMIPMGPFLALALIAMSIILV
jgi:Flp pilus assembly protein protease CpaA